jgi:hypothetical protein
MRSSLSTSGTIGACGTAVARGLMTNVMTSNGHAMVPSTADLGLPIAHENDAHDHVPRPTEAISALDESQHHLDPGGDDLFAVGVDGRLTQ